MKKDEPAIPDFQNKNHFSGETFPAVFLNEPIPHDLRFDNCEIKYLLFFEGEFYETRKFEFFNCTIDQIEIHNKIHDVSFFDCTIKKFTQEESSHINSLFFKSTSSEYSIKNLTFIDGETDFCIILGYKIGSFNISNHSFENIAIEDNSFISNFNTFKSKYSYLLFKQSTLIKSEFSFIEDSEVMFNEVNAKNLTFRNKCVNSKVTLYKTKIEELLFESFKNSNSILTFEEVAIKNLFKLTYSNLGQSELIDCELTTCQILTKASTLTQINSIRVNWPIEITISDPDNKLTDDRRNLEKMEFWRQLKVNAINQKNQFNALQFYAREMGVKFSAFKSFPQIASNSKPTKILLWLVNPIIDLIDLLFSSFKKRNAEGIMLWWHKYTSSFGIDWFRPTLLYLALSFSLFFYLSEYILTFNFHFDIFKDQNFYYFLDPLKSKKIEFTNHAPFVIAAVSLITSILQGLLIYQIIQGFRKYSFKS